MADEKDVRLRFYVTSREHMLLKIAAALAGETASEFLRQAMLSRIREVTKGAEVRSLLEDLEKEPTPPSAEGTASSDDG